MGEAVKMYISNMLKINEIIAGSFGTSFVAQKYFNVALSLSLSKIFLLN